MGPQEGEGRLAMNTAYDVFLAFVLVYSLRVAFAFAPTPTQGKLPCCSLGRPLWFHACSDKKLYQRRLGCGVFVRRVRGRVTR